MSSCGLPLAKDYLTLLDPGRLVYNQLGRTLLLDTRAYSKAHAAGDEEKMAKIAEAMALSLQLLLDWTGMFDLFDLFAPDKWTGG